MIKASKLTHAFGETTALDGIDFEIQPGQVCAYLGPNGAGKTTTVRILTGTLLPTAGSVSVAGYDPISQRQDVQQRIGYVPESGAVYMTLSVSEYLSLAGALHRLEPSEVAHRSKMWLELFGLAATHDRRLDSLSKGMRQKVVLTSALLHDPEVLILDEPLSGLDAIAAHLFKDVLRSLADRGKTIMFCTHALDVAERLCDKVVILNHGRIVGCGETKEVISGRNLPTLEAVFRDITEPDPETGRTERLLRALIRGK